MPPRLARQADGFSRTWEARLRAQAAPLEPVPRGRVCLICNTPGADPAAFAQGLRRAVARFKNNPVKDELATSLPRLINIQRRCGTRSLRAFRNRRPKAIRSTSR